MFGKSAAFLPNIGKIGNRRFAAGVGILPKLGKFTVFLPNIGKISRGARVAAKYAGGEAAG